MKIRKTMTERALRANHENGKKNSGPKNTELTKLNAVTHGLLAKKLVFENDADKQCYEELLAEHMEYHDPVGPAETAQVSVMCISLRGLGEVCGWESTEIQNHKRASAALFEGLNWDSNAQKLPLFSATQQSWQAVELVLRNGVRAGERNVDDDETTDETGHLVVEAKLRSSLDTILRYKAALMRDYYRALATLQALQQERFELDALQPFSEEAGNEKN